MSKALTVEFNTTQANIERLHCFSCKGYLSCPPIRLLPDGSNICGQCSPFDNATAYRQVTLEAILSAATFPCRFTQYGCTERLLFGNTINHEASCDHRPLACVSCPWEGSAMQISEHLHIEHSEYIKEEAQFLIEVHASSNNWFVVDKNGMIFIVKYLYDAKSNELKYDIRYVSNVKGEICKVKLINFLEPDYIVQCIGGKCSYFDHGFKDMLNNTVLYVDKYLENLNEPVKITVAFNFDSFVPIKNVMVNYDLIEANKCKKCQYYLMPPVYYSKDGIICFDCSCNNDGSKLTVNKNVSNLMAVQNYPCRWKNCDFIGLVDAIRIHELQCKFRVYRCTVPACNTIFTRTDLVDHFKTHDRYLFFDGQVSFKVNFENCSSDVACLFTVIDNENVVIEYCPYSGNYYYLTMQNYKDPNPFAATIYFEHAHCKCKSKLFSLDKKHTKIYQTELPGCFQPEDELTATLKIG